MATFNLPQRVSYGLTKHTHFITPESADLWAEINSKHSKSAHEIFQDAHLPFNGLKKVIFSLPFSVINALLTFINQALHQNHNMLTLSPNFKQHSAVSTGWKILAKEYCNNSNVWIYCHP